MLHSRPARLAVLLVAMLGLASWLFAVLAGRNAIALDAVHDGRRLFETYCGTCHEPAAMRTTVRARPSSTRDELLVYLRDHGESNDEEDRAIVDYLLRPTTTGEDGGSPLSSFLRNSDSSFGASLRTRRSSMPRTKPPNVPRSTSTRLRRK